MKKCDIFHFQIKIFKLDVSETKCVCNDWFQGQQQPLQHTGGPQQ